MTKRHALYAFLPTVIFVLVANYSQAQQQGSVGINIILKPIQIIQVNDKRDKHNHKQQQKNDVNPNQHGLVNVFGTADYEVTVNKVALSASRSLPAEVSPMADLYRKGTNAVEKAAITETQEREIDFLQTLILYSIQVN